MVKEECGFTMPWLGLDPSIVRKYAQGKFKHPPKPLNEVFPIQALKGVKGKDVLCLASGGGQQSAVFGLLGARVTVVDIAEGQLEGDRKAARHYGYQVTTIQGDMGDLSSLKANSVDLVYQAPSMCYVSDVKRVYTEVARVLRKRGLYRVDASNPLAQFIDESSWDGNGYRVSVPYAVKEKKRAVDKNVIEYRHTLEDAFNGLLENGFNVEYVQESPSDLYHTGTPIPGTWEHSELYLPGSFVILARKK